jgi:hypothetical protein
MLFLFLFKLLKKNPSKSKGGGISLRLTDFWELAKHFARDRIYRSSRMRGARPSCSFHLRPPLATEFISASCSAHTHTHQKRYGRGHWSVLSAFYSYLRLFDLRHHREKLNFLLAEHRRDSGRATLIAASHTVEGRCIHSPCVCYYTLLGALLAGLQFAVWSY